MAEGSRERHDGMASRTDGRAEGEAGRPRVYIADGREDLDFADQLGAGLDACGFDPVLDRHGIAGEQGWQRRLGALIQAADTVVFVLSPSSATSKVGIW